jgi:predicted Zn finger-like uncharacterized protein
MILNCPSCRTKYLVPDSAIGMDGRKVRCAQCRFSWFQEGSTDVAPAPSRRAPEPQRSAEVKSAPERVPAQARARPAPPVAQPEPEPDPIPDYPPEPPPPSWDYQEADEPRRGRRNPARMWTLVAVIAALVMVSALAAIYYVGPQQIGAWMSGGDVASGERLRFTRRDVSREPLPTDKELLTVTGEITNVSAQVQRVPQIRADVTDTEERVIFSWTIAPPVGELQPGQAATFSSASTDVPKGGRNLNLSFGPS